MVRNALKYKAKEETRGRKTVVSEYTKRMIKNASTKNPLLAATEIRYQVCPSISAEAVRRVLRQNNLCGQSPSKVQKRIRFANAHLEWPTEKCKKIL